MTKRDFEGPGNRLRQLERVLLLIDLLSPLRYGATTDELARDVVFLLGVEYCERTVRRDLKALEQLGIVESVRTRDERRVGGRLGYRWRWADRSPRAAALGRVAELQSA